MPGARAARRALVAAVAAFGLLTGAAWAALADTGVDVSSHQHNHALNWTKAKADGVTFAYIKATEGSSYTNPWFAGDWSTTGQLGIYHGAYHFARPSIGSAANQARYFVKVAGLQQSTGVLPPVLDLEVTGGLKVRALRTWVATWLQTVQQLTGRDPMIYVSPYFWKTYLGNSTAFHAYPLWVANYGVSMPQVPGGWPTWTFWQSTSSGSINGISGRVDIDQFNGDPTHLALMANIKDGSAPPDTTGTTSPAPSPTPRATTLSATTSSSAVYQGTPVTVSGALRTTTGGVAGRRVSLWQETDSTSGYQQVATATTDSSGAYSFSVTPTATASYVVKWAGSSGYAAASSPALTVTLQQATASTLSLASSRLLLYPNQSSVLSGQLRTATAPLAGKTVYLWRQRVGAARWRHAGRTRTSSTGAFSFQVRPTASSTYVVKWRGGTAYTSAASTPVRVNYQSTIPTTVSFGLSRARAYAGQRVQLTGTLDSVTGKVAGQSVEVYRQPDGEGTPSLAATLTTDKTGGFSLGVGATATTTYTVRFPGTDLYEAADASPSTMTLLLPQRTALDIRSGRTNLRVGRQTTLRGHLQTSTGAGVAHRRVKIFRRVFGSPTWHRVAVTRTTGPRGYWEITVHPHKGSVFRAEYGGAMRFSASRSGRLRVHVR